MRRDLPLVLTLFLGLCLSTAGGCGDDMQPKSGAELFRLQACATCHGPDGHGSALAPTLAAASSRWKKPALVEYLRDPVAYQQKDERLRLQAHKYTLPMTKFDMLKPAELDALADYVLALP